MNSLQKGRFARDISVHSTVLINAKVTIFRYRAIENRKRRYIYHDSNSRLLVIKKTSKPRLI